MSYSNSVLKNLKTKIGISLSALVVVGGSLLLSSTALAAGHTLYVGHGSVGNNSSCKSPGYNSVQAAVNAAGNGQTVYLCGGQFAQQVFISKSITLTGDWSSGLTAVGTTFTTSTASYPAAFTTDDLFTPQAQIVVTGANSDVTINNLNISGPFPSNGGCANDDYGILALGGRLNLNNDQVLNTADSNSALYGCQFGVGIEIGAGTFENSTFSNWPTVNFVAKADINNVTVSGYQKNGITVDGSGSKADISGSTITGGGPTAPFGTIIGQNGIQISDGATGNINGNRISGNAYSGDGYASATGILIWGGWGYPLTTGVQISNNTLYNNDIGVALVNYSSDGSGASTSRTDDSVYGNYIFSSAVTNVSGLCNNTVSCGGAFIGYQAGIEDIGNGDSIFYNQINGRGYAAQGQYNYSVVPSVFTQTGPNSAFVRPIDAGSSFPTINAKVYGNNYGNFGYNQYYNGGGRGYRGHHGWGWRF